MRIPLRAEKLEGVDLIAKDRSVTRCIGLALGEGGDFGAIVEKAPILSISFCSIVRLT